MLDLPEVGTSTEDEVLDLMVSIADRMLAGKLTTEEVAQASDWVSASLTWEEAKALLLPHVVYIREPHTGSARAIGPFKTSTAATEWAARLDGTRMLTDVVAVMAPLEVDEDRCDIEGCDQPPVALLANDAPLLSPEYAERRVCRWHRNGGQA